MKIAVRLRLPDERVVELGPEAIIGRMRSAALRLNDPAISEAHALVSLRGTQLKLLALRGRFVVDGEQQAECTLRAGMTIELAPNLALGVVEVSLPTAVLAVRAQGMPLQILPPIASINARSGELVAGFDPGAEALLWIDGDEVRIRRPGCEDETLRVGAALDVAGTTFVFERMSLRNAGVSSTQRGTADGPLRLVLRFDSAHVHTRDHVVPIDGIPARLLCELAEFSGPVEWRTAAREIWPEETDDTLLRRNWDAGLSRLRRALLDHGVRGDLVRGAGRGKVELFLHHDDVVNDEQ
ncbi:MAG: FHA domain-containing protein [Deltaproteobacteria bacterium]|nr:FHA domain-containing protein [Deltaproteobacteria bacterium]